jgi:CubicO group peptidase (beta-lactamase class C family)
MPSCGSDSLNFQSSSPFFSFYDSALFGYQFLEKVNSNKSRALWLLLVSVLLGLFNAQGEQSQSDNEGVLSDRVNQLVEDRMYHEQIPGVALAVIKEGKTLKLETYGFADVDLKTPVTTNTVFRIDSISKQFLATAIMMLVEEGKISLDDPVSKYLDGTPKRWQAITIRHLLTHTSGIPDFNNENIPVKEGPEDFDHRALNALAKRHLHFAPGDEYRYSNSNYHLLGMIIQKITGGIYDDFLRERIFKPLGMSQTTISHEGERYPGLASGYRWENGLHQTGPPTGITAGGSILSTISDMAKWDAALYPERLLKESSLQQMWAPVRLNDGMTWRYGFGWEVSRINDHLIVSHGGNIKGFSSAIECAVDDQLTVVVLDNRFNSYEAAQRLVYKIARIYLWKGPDYQPIPDKEPKVTERVRNINDLQDRGKLTAADFTPAVWAEISPWQRETKGDLEKVGPALSLTLVERTNEPGRRSYRYRIQYKIGTDLLHVVFDEQNKISVWKTEDVDLK